VRIGLDIRAWMAWVTRQIGAWRGGHSVALATRLRIDGTRRPLSLSANSAYGAAPTTWGDRVGAGVAGA